MDSESSRLRLCPVCGSRFERPYRYSDKMWAERVTCGRACQARWLARRPLEERFFEKVLCEVATRCWLWTASTQASRFGYGQFKRGAGLGMVSAHRWAYEHLVGPVPPGLHLDHLCRTPRCCNPSHLEPVTARENNWRSVSRSAMNARKTACIHGHVFDEANTHIRPNGRRECRECNRLRVNALRRRR
jgi:HNH endonuclease